MSRPTIKPQACLGCTKPSGTLIVCLQCQTGLSKSQIQKMDHAFQIAVIELFGRQCVDCDVSTDDPENGLLCADHLETKKADPLSRYDLANAVARCCEHHNKRHSAEIAKVPPAKKLPKETAEKQAKVKKLAVCSILGCIAWGTFPDGKCFNHSKHVKL